MGMHPAKNGLDIGLLVGDIEASLAFYQGLLGLEKIGEMPVPFGHMHRLAFGDSVVKLVAPKKIPPPGVSGLTKALGLRYLTFPISNLDAVCAACATAGVTFDIQPQTLMPGLRIAMVRDPDGNVVEFVERS